MIDLKTLKAGYTVNFRCGGGAKVMGVSSDCNSVLFEGMGDKPWFNYERNGSWWIDGEHPLDIVEITHPLFDWDDVKQGMAFEWNGSNAFFIGNHLEDNSLVIVETIDGYDGIEKSALTRAPEKDIK